MTGTIKENLPTHIQIRGTRAHNLKNIDVDIPLHKITGIAGVSGSGKSSLALGVLYAEGSRRYLESLSTYTRRRMTEASRARRSWRSTRRGRVKSARGRAFPACRRGRAFASLPSVNSLREWQSHSRGFRYRSIAYGNALRPYNP